MEKKVLSRMWCRHEEGAEMSDLKGYRCPNCGQMLPISRSGIYTCEYCGSQYKAEDEYGVLKIERLPFKSIQLTLQKRIALEYLIDRPQEILAYSLEEMAKEMAEKLLPYMEYDIAQDPQYMDCRMRGRIRIAIPERNPIEAIQAMSEKVLVEEVAIGNGCPIRS